MTTIPQIKTVIPISNSLFSHMSYDFLTVTASQLDILFYATYGERNISPVLQSSVVDTSAITDIELGKIALLLVSVYKNKWDRYKSILTVEYDKIHNYLDEYTESVTSTNLEETTGVNTSTGTDTDHDNGINTRTDNLTKNASVASTKTNTNTETDTTYGFNSSAAVNSDGSQSTLGVDSTDTTEVNDTGTQKNEFSSDKVKTLEKEINNHVTVNDNGTKQRTYSHQGNIGNLTTQEMLKQEIQLWEWNFVESILNDAKELLTLPIYLS